MRNWARGEGVQLGHLGPSFFFFSKVPMPKECANCIIIEACNCDRGGGRKEVTKTRQKTTKKAGAGSPLGGDKTSRGGTHLLSFFCNYTLVLILFVSARLASRRSPSPMGGELRPPDPPQRKLQRRDENYKVSRGRGRQNLARVDTFVVIFL